MTGKVVIDSCAIRIPLEAVKPQSWEAAIITDQEDRYQKKSVYTDTLTGEFQETPQTGVQNFTDTDSSTGEIKTKYWTRAERHEGKDFVNCLNIGLHSKHLHNNYFKGLAIETIEQALQTIKQQGHFDFDISQVIEQGKFTQTDLKLDDTLTEIEYKQLCSELINATRESKFQNKTAKKWAHGIEWGARDSKKHAKTYHKSKQMLSEHPQFTQTYLHGMPGDIVRFEAKISGAKEFKALGFAGNNVCDVLCTDQDTYSRAIARLFYQVVDIDSIKHTQQVKPQERMSTEQIFAVMLFEQLTKNPYSTERILNIMTRHIHDKANRHRKKRQLQEWFNAWLTDKYEAFNHKHFTPIFE